MKTSTGISLATLLSFVGLVVFAFLCYAFIIWSNCDSSLSSFFSDFRAFHGSGC
ncbi:hypothetical protein ACHAAC_01790 [Aeromicrobium sp. CF4.19]|uniref:hypothetical protein n=1 Tax=Aeromicrobium sp. CF4.19 TaxID=3373082 RepID=UPI003EE62FEA